MNHKSFLLIAVLAVAFGSVLGAQQPTAPSPVFSDILKLASAGVGDEVLLAYVQSAKGPVLLTADDVITLKNAKVGTAVIQALLAKAPGPTVAPEAPQTLNPDPRAVPPVPYELMPVSPGPDFQWYPGHWYWRRGWVWVPGVWTPLYMYPRYHYWNRW